jgi:hypothetical protein
MVVIVWWLLFAAVAYLVYRDWLFLTYARYFAHE